MKIERTKIKITLFDNEIELRKPSLREVQEYRDGLRNLGESNDATKVIGKFLVKLGIPENDFQDLEMGHIEELLDLVTNPKKKSM